MSTRSSQAHRYPCQALHSLHAQERKQGLAGIIRLGRQGAEPRTADAGEHPGLGCPALRRHVSHNATHVSSGAEGLVMQADGEATRIRPMQRTWLMMPFMHSESLADQQVRPAADMQGLAGHLPRNVFDIDSNVSNSGI